MRLTNLFDDAIQMLAEHPQSTHDIAVGASAVRFFRLLAHFYPAIFETTAEIQGTLIYYLKLLSNTIPNIENVALEKNNVFESLTKCVHLQGVLKMIRHIDSSLKWKPEEKIKIFSSMLSIAACHPGINWDKKHEHWSTNFIHMGTPDEECVTVSPAVTLNLIAHAILDIERYIVSPPKNPEDDRAACQERDLIARLESFGIELLQLRQQEEAGHYELCASGRQHQLLALINHAFLDADGQPFRPLLDTMTFLLDTLTHYIEKKMELLGPEVRRALIFEGIKWQNETSAETSPLIAWFRTQFPNPSDDLSHVDALWQEDCRNYLEQQCILFGLNPAVASDKILSVIKHVASVPMPCSEGAIVPLVEKLFAQTPFDVALSASDEEAMHELLNCANDALQKLKQTITPQTPARVFKEFAAAWDAVEAIKRQSLLDIFIPFQDYQVYEEARLRFQHVLLAYFKSEESDEQLYGEFENRKKKYYSEYKKIEEALYCSLIVNLFSLSIINLGLAEQHAQELLALSTDFSRHPINLTDEHLQAWFDRARQESPDMLDISITPYQVNRILFNIFLKPLDQWSSLYKEALDAIVKFLSQPNTAETPAPLQDFKKSYSRTFLFNLILVLRQEIIGLTSENKSKLPLDAEGRLKYRDFFNTCIYQRIIDESWQINNFDLLIDVASEWTDTYFLNPWGYDLYNLLNESSSQLTQAHKYKLLSVRLQKGCPELNTYWVLATLFQLPLEKFNSEYRELMFKEIKPRLRTFGIADGTHFRKLMELPHDRLNPEQRAELFRIAVVENQCRCISSFYSLISVFEVPVDLLSSQQRDLIICTIEPQLGGAITVENFFLEKFFALIRDGKLSPTQCQRIMSALNIQPPLSMAENIHRFLRPAPALPIEASLDRSNSNQPDVRV